MSRNASVWRIPIVRAVVISALASALACRSGDESRAQSVPGGDPDRGRQLIAVYGCGSCHTVPGVRASVGRVGPRFDDLADRAFIAGGLRNEPAQLIRWIRFPQEVRPGTVMPDLGVTEAHASDIAAYLYTLRAGGLGPPHLFPTRALPAH